MEESVWIRILITSAILVGCWLGAFILRRVARRVANRQGYAAGRIAHVKVMINVSALAVAVLLLAALWGFEQNLVVFASSIFALVGVALFASWSMLSNVTAALMLYFTAPFLVQDRIRILDGDNTVTGHIRQMGLIFLTLEDDHGHLYTLPNNVLLQKTVIRLQPGKELPCERKHCQPSSSA